MDNVRSTLAQQHSAVKRVQLHAKWNRYTAHVIRTSQTIYDCEQRAPGQYPECWQRISRIACGLTQAEIARRCGYSQVQISRAESDVTKTFSFEFYLRWSDEIVKAEGGQLALDALERIEYPDYSERLEEIRAELERQQSEKAGV